MTSRRPRPLAVALGLLFALAMSLPGPIRAADDDGDWHLTVEALRKQEQTIRERIGAFANRHASEAVRLTQGMEPLLREGARLSLWQATASDPWEIRDILAGFARLSVDVAKLLQRPEQILEILEQDVVLLETFRERLAESMRNGMPAPLRQDVAETERAMANLRQMLASLRDVIAVEARPLQDLATRVRTAQDRLQASLAPSWKGYYSRRFSSLFTEDYGITLREDLEDWQQWVVFIRDQFRIHRNAGLFTRGLAEALASTLLAAVIMVLATRLAARRGWPRPRGRVLALATACLLGGLFFVLMASLGPPFLFIAANSVGEILLTAALVCFTRLHRVAANVPTSPPILWPMWRLFALGLLLEALRAPEALMGPVLAVVFLGSAVAFARKMRRTPREQRLDRSLTLALAVLLPILAGLSLFGLPQAAVLSASAFFYIALALRFAATTMRFLARLESRGHRPVTASILHGAGFPFYFLAYLFLFLWLLSTQYGGENVFLEIVAAEARFESIGISLQKLVTLVAGYYAARAARSAAAAGIEGLSSGRRFLEPGVRASLLTINTYFWWGCFTIFTLSVLGLSLTNLAVVAGGLSVGIGFGLQNLVNNFIGGLILLFGRSVQAGDTLQVGESLGVVREVNIRNTEVLTLDNATVFVPNSELVSGKIINWSHKDPSARQYVSIGVAYGSDTAKVRQILLEAAAACPAVLANPAPSVLHWDFGPSALEFRLRVWLSDVPGASSALSAIRVEIDRLFREAGIEIAFPQTDVHLRSAPALEQLTQACRPLQEERLAAIDAKLAALETLIRSGAAFRDGSKKDTPHD
jgi:small-conductance mechanosensitive channel